MTLGEIKGLLIDAGIALDGALLRTFINAGQKMLDRMSDFPHGQAEIAFTVNAADYFLVFPTRVRIVHGVWIKEATTDRGIALEKKDYVVLRAMYPNPSESSFYAKPLYYAHTTSIIASLGSPLIDELAMPVDDVPLSSDDPYDYKGLFLAPTPDTTYYLKVLVTAYSRELIADTEESFWSKHHPFALFNATMYKIEGFLRNANSAKDYLLAAQADITGVNYDSVEDELQDRPNYMGL